MVSFMMWTKRFGLGLSAVRCNLTIVKHVSTNQSLTHPSTDIESVHSLRNVPSKMMIFMGFLLVFSVFNHLSNISFCLLIHVGITFWLIHFHVLKLGHIV